jgi:hypothetical protein
MATLTVIMGLCGSGKSHILMDLVGKSPMGAYVKDEGLLTENFEENYEYLLVSLQNGINSFVAGAEFCFKENQEFLENRVKKDIPEIVIEYVSLENNPEKANSNVKKRTNKSDVEGHIKINNELTNKYHIPEGSKIIPITEI